MIYITRLIIFNTLLFGASLNASDNFENYEIRFDISFPFASLGVFYIRGKNRDGRKSDN